MSCPSCSRSYPVPTCTTTLYIGSIADTDTDVYVYVKNKTTGRTQRLESTSDSSGYVSVTLTDIGEGFFAEKFLYEFWITLQSEGLNTKEEITFDGYETDTCVLVDFLNIFDVPESIYDLIQFSEHTLTIQ